MADRAPIYRLLVMLHDNVPAPEALKALLQLPVFRWIETEKQSQSQLWFTWSSADTRLSDVMVTMVSGVEACAECGCFGFGFVFVSLLI